MKKFTEYKKQIYKVIKDEFTRTALRRAVSSFRKARDEALKMFPYVEEERKKLREIKEKVLSNLEYWIDKVMEIAKKNKVNVYFAKNSCEALEIIKNIVGNGKRIVKSKSITSEELELNKYLEEWGNEVYETDLGEFIVQLLKSRPMHILTPAVNVPKEKVAELFSKVAGKDLPSDPVKLTLFAREYLRDKFITADVGISGANVITADTGSVFLIENEGNIRFVTNAPPVHIVLCGVEKILPTLRDGMLFVEVISRYAGYPAMTYVSIISGPSKTGDIEKTVVYGAHGPRELHIILLDNGRCEVAKNDDLREFLLCARCGACMYECAVYPITTGYWGYRYMGGIGIPWTAFIAGGLEEAAPLAFTCTLCGRCKKYCPMEIDTPKLVEKIRKILFEKDLIPPYIKKMVEEIKEKGVPY